MCGSELPRQRWRAGFRLSSVSGLGREGDLVMLQHVTHIYLWISDHMSVYQPIIGALWRRQRVQSFQRGRQCREMAPNAVTFTGFHSESAMSPQTRPNCRLSPHNMNVAARLGSFLSPPTTWVLRNSNLWWRHLAHN